MVSIETFLRRPGDSVVIAFHIIPPLTSFISPLVVSATLLSVCEKSRKSPCLGACPHCWNSLGSTQRLLPRIDLCAAPAPTPRPRCPLLGRSELRIGDALRGAGVVAGESALALCLLAHCFFTASTADCKLTFHYSCLLDSRLSVVFLRRPCVMTSVEKKLRTSCQNYWSFTTWRPNACKEQGLQGASSLYLLEENTTVTGYHTEHWL